MTGLFIVLGIVAFFVFLFSVPIHIIIQADTEPEMDAKVFVRILFFQYVLFPRKKTKKKSKETKKTKKAAKKSSKTASKTEKKEPKPKPKRDILGLVKLVAKLAAAVLKKFPKHFGVRILRYEIILATGDAAKTAVLYGAVTGLSAGLFDLLRNGTKFRIAHKAPVNVYTDFLGEKSKAHIAIDFFISLGGVLSMAMAAGLVFVKEKNAQKLKKEKQAKKVSENPKKSENEVKTAEK